MYGVLNWSASLAVVLGETEIPAYTAADRYESGRIGRSRKPIPNSAENTSDKDTEELFESESNRRFAALSRVALRKLIQMNQVRTLSDLAVPPGNRLEALRSGPERVAIADYH